MGIQQSGENVVLVVLPPEPQIDGELKAVNELVSKRCDFDVIIDFSRVEILTSPNISNLLILHNWVNGCGHKLILFSVSFVTKCIFDVAGLDTLFNFVDDKSAALAALQPAKRPSP